MANTFSKEIRVAFDDVLEKFNDQLVVSALVDKFQLGDMEAERSSDVIWRPVPYISQSFLGIDQTANFGDSVQLSVPSQVGTIRSGNFTMNARELRDGLQESRQADAVKQKLASDINIALMDTAADEGTQVVAIATAATGYDDVALADAQFNEQGIQMDGRVMTLSSRDYNGMAGNLAERQTLNKMPTEAFRKSFVGEVAGFQTHKLDYANNLVAAAGVTVTFNGADQHLTPVATVTAANGIDQTNVDNREQLITIGVVSGTVKVGDAFTVAGVNSVHMITKRDTGQLKTFRINEIVTGAGGAGTVRISPPIITTDVTSTAADVKYQNATATPANGAAITFLNIATASVNPFWRKNAIELLPARLVLPEDTGLRVLHGTTDQGIDLLMTSSGDINDLSVKFRFDVFFGTVMLMPEQAGIMMFGQV